MTTSDQERAAPAQQPVAVKRWPFEERPGPFADRLYTALAQFTSVLSAIRHVLIEEPPVLSREYLAEALPASSEPELRAEIVSLRASNARLGMIVDGNLANYEREIVSLTRERDELRACEASWEQTRLAIAHMRNENGGLRSRVEALSAEVGTARAAAFEEAAQILHNKRHSRPDTPRLETWNEALESGATAIRARAALDKGAARP